MSRARDLMGAGAPAGLARAISSGGAAVTSAGTGSIANAKLLPNETNNLSAAANLDSYLLPSTAQGSQIGDMIFCYTTSSTSAVVYGGTGETINAAATFTIAQDKLAIFKRISATQWGAIVTA
jgi:hypothetical protein